MLAARHPDPRTDEPTPASFPAAVVARGTVLRVLSPARLELRTREGLVRGAALAAAGYDDPRIGDQVLTLTDETGALYVVGVLQAARAAGEVHGPHQVRDVDGRLLFEHDPATRKSVLHAPAGNLELRADDGTIDLVARDAVRVRADRVDVVAKTLSTVAERSQEVFGVLETRATRIVERAKTAYREVEDLAQTRAGRIRQVARETLQLVGRRAFLRSEEGMKLRAEKIHLA